MKTKSLKFKTVLGSFTMLGVEYSGECEIEDPSPEQVKLAGSAHAAGVLEVTDGLDVSHVESDEVSREKLLAAMGEWKEAVRDPETGVVLEPGRWTGPWAEGHYANAALAVGSAAVELVVDVDGGEQS